MIVSCEKCGKQYNIDPEQIKGEKAQFQCESCKSVITVSKQVSNPPKESPPKPSPPETKKKAPSVAGPRKRGVGLRPKMFFLFFIVPIGLIIAASLLTLNNMRTLTNLLTQESSHVVTKIAEETVADKARAVAREVELYLMTHPDLKKEDFQENPEFMNVAVQKVGITGNSLVMSRPTENEPITMWANPDKELIGIDIVEAMRKTLGAEYERWYKVQGKNYEVGGYYTWIDKREKYQFSVPIEGYNLNAVATAYLDEFTLPMIDLEARANNMLAQTTRTMTIVLAATARLIALVVAVYSYRLSGRLKSLSSAADRISVGNLDVEIEGTKSRDEIGVLANDLSRMQTSIRLAIKRLRERR
jgi:predicted Zn finger-like uncharacterized protein